MQPKQKLPKQQKKHVSRLKQSETDRGKRGVSNGENWGLQDI